jgi:threonyl-tRNA synthetase
VSSTITVRHGDATAELDAGATAIQALKALEAVRGQIVAARVDGQPWDLDREVPDDAEVEAIAADSEEGRAILRHSLACLRNSVAESMDMLCTIGTATTWMLEWFRPNR